MTRRFPAAQMKRRLLLMAAMALGMLTGDVGVAQQAGSIDLTQIEPRLELRQPPVREGDPTGHRGAITHSSSCSPIPKDASSVQTTLVWLDRDQYSETDRPKFEARILNTGSVPIKIPFSPHLAAFQPKDPGAKFSFWEMFVTLEIIIVARNVEWYVSGGGAALFGNESHPGTMLTLEPGEWVQVIAQGQPVGDPLSNLPPLAHSAEAITHINASIDIHHDEMLLTSTESATVQHPLCIKQTEGPNVTVKLK
jgi:hypothetical protein